MTSNTKTLIRDRLRSNPVVKLYKTYIIDSIIIAKTQGFKALLRQKGWRFLLVIFLYYLIRDTIIYIIIPFLIARGLIE